MKEALITKTEEPYKLPNNWVWVNLGNVVGSVKGKKPKELLKSREKETIPYVTINYMTTGENAETQYLYKNQSKVECKPTDILMVWDGARSGLVGKGVSGEVGSTLVKLNNIGLCSNYLYYFLKSKYNFINKNHRGTGIPHVNPEVLWRIAFPVPPLGEQQRIAKKVHYLLDKIDEAKKSIEEAEETFELRQAAILDKAFRGELTKEWRKNNISCIPSSIAPRYFKEQQVNNDFYRDFDLPSSWIWTKAENVFLVQPRNGYSPKATKEITDTKTLKLGAITKGYFIRDEYKYINEIIKEDSHLWLKKGDFLIQRANSLDYVGTSAIYTGEDNEFIYPDLIMKGKLNKELVFPKYMVFWINSYYGKKYIKQNATGTSGNMPKINQKVVKNILIPLPPVEEQIEIMRIVEQVNKKAIELNIINAYESIEKLKQSILSKAFRGELGTNDPSEENAIELLKEVLEEQIK